MSDTLSIVLLRFSVFSTNGQSCTFTLLVGWLGVLSPLGNSLPFNRLSYVNLLINYFKQFMNSKDCFKLRDLMVNDQLFDSIWGEQGRKFLNDCRLLL